MMHTGGCICGAVRYEITGEPHVTYVCHCTDCRRQSGSAFGLTSVLTADQLKITRGELKTQTRVAESGRTLTRYFCPECGTWIYNVPESLPTNRRLTTRVGCDLRFTSGSEALCRGSRYRQMSSSMRHSLVIAPGSCLHRNSYRRRSP